MIEKLKKFLQATIEELNGYAEDEDNDYDDCERHDCRIAAEAYEEVLNFIEKQSAADTFLEDLHLEQLEQMG